MRVFAIICAVFLTAGSVLGQQATFKSGTSIVPVLTTVTDAQGRLVPNLEQEDFTILDNGKPQADHALPERDAALHRRRDAGFQLQHEQQPGSAEGGDRAVHPADAARRQGAGGCVQRQDSVQRRVHQRPRRPGRGAEGSAVRQPDAPLRRDRREHRHPGRGRGPEDRAGLHRRRRYGEQEGHGRASSTRPRPPRR